MTSKCGFGIVGLLLLNTPPVVANSSGFGAIEGIVTDPSSAVVPETAIQVRDVATAAVFTTSTNDRGVFWFPAVPVGTYELTAEKPGFARWIDKEVVVTVGARVNLDIALAIGTTETATTVHAQRPLLETTRSQVSTTIDERAIDGLPVNGRNFLDLILLTPGAVSDPRGTISFTGQRKTYSVLVDGADANNTFFAEPLGTGSDHAPYSLDTIEQFQVNSSSYSAELGRTGSGLVNVVTKSGSNDYRGSAFWYYRDRSLNATDLINKISGEPKSPYHFNQFGGVLGGPVQKDRIFFFGNYEGQRSTFDHIVELNLPARFQPSSDPAVAGFQQRALDYLKARDSSWIRTFDQNLAFARSDWSLGSRHILSLRWNGQRFDGEGQENVSSPQISSEHTGATLVATDTFGVVLTSTISSSWLNVARFGHARYRLLGRANTANAEANVFEAGQLALAIGRNPTSPREVAIRRFEWSDTLSHSHGPHLMRAGFDIVQDAMTFLTPSNFSGSYRFNSLESFGRSLADAPLPLPGERYIQAFSGEGTPGTTVHPDLLDFGAFAQDEWRVTRELTLNLGVRSDVEMLARPPVRNPSRALAAAGLDTSFVPAHGSYVAPRVGMAWTLPSSDRVVVRGGYGLFYGRTPSQMSSRAHFQNGVTVQTRTFVGDTPAAALIPAYPDNICGPPSPSGTPPSCGAPTGGGGPPILMLFDREYVSPLVHQASAGIELQLLEDLVLSAGYIFARGVDLQRIRDINLDGTVPATIAVAHSDSVLAYTRFTTPRPIPEFDRIFVFESAASSVYHGLTLQVTRRFANALQFLGSYTWSRVVDDNPDPTAINPPTTDLLLVANPSDPEGDRSRGMTDQRHRFVLSGVWDLDYADRLPALARIVLGGWLLGGIFTAQSGQPYSGILNFDLNNDGNLASDRTPNSARNRFTLPANATVDLRVTRAFPLMNPHTRLELSWEAFNLFNRANVTAVRRQQFALSKNASDCGTGVPQCLVPQDSGPGAFGTPTSTSGPRIMQLAARLVF
jgi:Carboxypeptidase regulatory-like domain